MKKPSREREPVDLSLTFSATYGLSRKKATTFSLFWEVVPRIRENSLKCPQFSTVV
jgi:hypothetical protein